MLEHPRKYENMVVIPVDAGAVMFAPTRSLEWQLRYGDAIRVRYIAAAVVESFEYLLSKNITTKEAIRRLRIMRNVE